MGVINSFFVLTGRPVDKSSLKRLKLTGTGYEDVDRIQLPQKVNIAGDQTAQRDSQVQFTGCLEHKEKTIQS